MDDVARMPLVRRVVNRYMSNQISRVCGQKIPDTQCGYRMLHRELIPDMLGGGHRFDYETEALIIASRKGYQDRISPNHDCLHRPGQQDPSRARLAPLFQNDAALSESYSVEPYRTEADRLRPLQN